ncbi:hypothetical protein P879_01271 [Paragonimus westermani]|uniref:ascorbate ferrireductase (transmembrane) n=1 Tax=Paragonimus westermani TaxID=34504 RepID=A0A8T0DTL5_9TREM|nr:hypothetical protein P879_01271 [Paragonimus westermani]
MNNTSNEGQINSVNVYVRAHACLMLFAWGFCCPNGLLAARHFKTAWPGGTIRKWKYWFTIHMSFQSVLFALVVLAFMIMVVNLTGYSTLSTLPYSAHPLLGFITFFLAFSNLFFAWMLITSTGCRRSLFRNFHLCVGLLAHAFSVPLILTGFQMPKMEMREKLEPFGLDAEMVIQRIAQNPRHKKQQVMELLSNKDVEEKELIQKSFKQIQTLRVAKYFLYAIHLMVSFSITFVLVIMMANL